MIPVDTTYSNENLLVILEGLDLSYLSAIMC